MRLPAVPRLSHRNYAIAKLSCAALGVLAVLVLARRGEVSVMEVARVVSD